MSIYKVNFFTIIFIFLVGLFSGAFVIDSLIREKQSIESMRSLCEYSKFATPHYKLIDDVIYCKSSDNSYQMLTKFKQKSDHNKEHQR